MSTPAYCGKCDKSQWVHYKNASRNGWLFCDDRMVTVADLPIEVVVATYRAAGWKIPAKLGDKARLDRKIDR